MSEEYITFTNEFGQTVQMSREDYQKKIIPYNLEMYWEDKEMLRQFAMELVRDQFPEQAAIAADRLIELYGPIESALIFRSVVHMQAGQFDQAKALLLNCLERYPTSGTACTNLAKIYAYEGDEVKAFETLQSGLWKDPNQENGLNMYVESFLHLDKKTELIERLEDLAEKEEAWRPQLLLGKLALQDENLLLAMQKYKAAIERSKEKEEAMLTVTGELGQAGYVYQLIQICEQFWTPHFQYPYIGFNYANALLATDERDKAFAVLRELKQHLAEEYKPMVDQFVARIPGAEEEKEAAVNGQVQVPTETEEPAKKSWWKFWK